VEVLRFNRIFAKKRLISGSNFGFFSGNAYSILLAKVVSMFRNVSEEVHVVKFFEFYSKFNFERGVVLIDQSDALVQHARESQMDLRE
jgi:poly(A) polymerase Pap1